MWEAINHNILYVFICIWYKDAYLDFSYLKKLIPFKLLTRQTDRYIFLWKEQQQTDILKKAHESLEKHVL